MGLINRYGQDLVGKHFLWYPYPNHWLVGEVYKLLKERGSCLAEAWFRIMYTSYLIPMISTFQDGSAIDKSSVLIKNSVSFQKYLELFNGTN